MKLHLYKLMVLVFSLDAPLQQGLAAFPTEVGHPKSRIGKASRETSTKGYNAKNGYVV